jgi:hypothetical protein
MKIAIVSESPTDEAVIRIIVDALSRRTNEYITSRRRAGGWSAAINAARAQLVSLHYNSDAHGMIVVVDSDESPVHDESHQPPNQPNPDCRVCRVTSEVERTRNTLQPRQHVNYRVEVATALAVPSLEAWLLCGTDPHITEARFQRMSDPELKNIRRELKRQLYGSLFPTREIATRETQRLCGDLAQLERHFPNGFGLFAKQIRSW